ncbi:efflux RND transporter periplasmic adaptor subunit [Bdellovibrio sp. HCB337]|uniref:efflux RND transporter periplasmic adaptor subunit n=1 Tax=Bdellovibrio sp. HCB337 TaxID=3394358 RepID=UPI0039A72DF5
MKNKKLIPVVILVLIVVGIAIKYYVFPSEFLYAGTLEATKVDISARVTSVIASRTVNEGDKVQQGQVLMDLDCEDFKLAAGIAGQNYDRALRLYRQGSEAKEAYDQMLNRKQDVDLKLSWCQIKAPLNGTVLNKYHEVGEMVNPGSRLFTMANLQDIYAYIYVPHDMLAKLRVGQSLTAALPEMKNREFTGVITHINEEAEFTPKNVQTREERTRLVFGIKITFNNQEEILKPGMTLEVRLPKE